MLLYLFGLSHCGEIDIVPGLKYGAYHAEIRTG
jgi:hypothetical protein